MNRLLGCRIQALRTATDFTQEQFADRIGISRQKYVRMENGATSITLDVLMKIADALNVQVEEITRVLDETVTVEKQVGAENTSLNKMFEMLDFFYANKHLNEQLQRKQIKPGDCKLVCAKFAQTADDVNH